MDADSGACRKIDLPLCAMGRANCVPYSAIFKQADLTSGSGEPSLCPTALVVDDEARSARTIPPGLNAERIDVPLAHSKFDLCLMLTSQDNGGYLGFCDYA